MKKLGILFVVLFALGVEAQEVKNDNEQERKEIKVDKKNERKEMLAQNLDSLTKLINQKAFALEASMIRDRYQTYNVLQDNNFIKVDGDEVIIQTANASRIGRNGMGGVTVRGQMISYNVTEAKNNTSVIMTVSTFALGTVNINLSVNSVGNATAFINGNFGLRATFIGDIVTINDVRQFEGMPQF